MQLCKRLNDEGADCCLDRHGSQPEKFRVAALFGRVSLLAAHRDEAYRQLGDVYLRSAQIHLRLSRDPGKAFHGLPDDLKLFGPEITNHSEVQWCSRKQILNRVDIVFPQLA